MDQTELRLVTRSGRAYEKRSYLYLLGRFPVLFPLLQNLVVLLGLAFVSLLLAKGERPIDFGQKSIGVQLGLGGCLAFLGVAVMAAPIPLGDDLVFDSRSVLLGVSGLFFGIVPTAFAVVATIGARVYEGGGGVLAGILLILVSAGLGLTFRVLHVDRLAELRSAELFRMGLITHVAVVLVVAMAAPDLPAAYWTTVAPIIVVFFPLAFLALSRLLVLHLSEGKRAAEAAASHRRYRSIFENNHLPMLVVDPEDGSILDANPAATEFYGWSRAELASKKVSDINCLTEAEIREELERARTREKSGFHFRHRLRDGSIREVHVTSGPIDLEGRQALFSMVQDITEKTQLERALQRSRTEALKLARAVQQSPVSIVITDNQGAILYVNPFFTTATGYASEEVVGRSTRILNSGVQPSSFYKQLWAEITTGSVWTGEFCNRRKDGTLFWEWASIAPINDDEGDRIGFVAVKQDITEQKRRMEELDAARQAAEEAVGAKEAFLSVVSHELKTPLNQIIAPCELLLEEIQVPQQRDFLETIHQASVRLNGQIDRILCFAQESRPTLNGSGFIDSADQWLVDMVQPYADRAATRGFQLRTQVEDGFASAFRANRIALEFIGTAYLENALKFGQSGVVNVRLLPSTNNRGRLRVESEGPSIPKERCEQLFEAFFQMDMEFTRANEGIGLGLALCRHYAEDAGGRVFAEPMAEGNAFLYEFPIDEGGHQQIPRSGL